VNFMALNKLPQHAELQDEQFVQVAGPDGLTSGFQYDAQQRALYAKESQVVFPSFHGHTHIAEDPVPSATCDTPGLMSADDKCKLDSLLQTRVGVLGFQGAGFPDDGGWLQGDIILAAGTDFISLERLGNVIRFTVDSPVPLNCACEECQQIFWLQDETDVASIRPPGCGGKMPGVNAYGELKIYLLPESTLVDPSNSAPALNRKDQYPALVFKRYDDAITPGTAEMEVILKRDKSNRRQTEIGWAFTPGATGIPQCVWFMGKDNNGNQIRFDLLPQSEPGLLGAILNNGHLISKKMGVVTDYTATILSTNQYTIREWDVDNQRPVGDPFTARNVWQYANPENPPSGQRPKTLLLDSAIDLVPIGTLVDIWYFKVGDVAGEPILRYYFSKKPALNPNHMWTWVGQCQFGDVSIARSELELNSGSDDRTTAVQVSTIRTFEQSLWGLTGYDDPLIAFDVAAEGGTEAGDVSRQHRAVIDTTLPGLRVQAAVNTPDDFSERPVWLWNRRDLCNALIRADIGRPTNSAFVPYDIILRAPVDEYTERYMKVVGKGVINGLHYVRVTGTHFHDLPPFGTVRVLSPDGNANKIYNYNRKFVFPTLISTIPSAPGTSGELTAQTMATAQTALTGSIGTPYINGAIWPNTTYSGPSVNTATTDDNIAYKFRLHTPGRNVADYAPFSVHFDYGDGTVTLSTPGIIIDAHTAEFQISRTPYNTPGTYHVIVEITLAGIGTISSADFNDAPWHLTITAGSSEKLQVEDLQIDTEDSSLDLIETQDNQIQRLVQAEVARLLGKQGIIIQDLSAQLVQEPTAATVLASHEVDLLDTVVLVGGSGDNIEYPGDVGDIIELVHQEYNSPIVRIEFSFNPSTGLVEMQFKVGTLDMSLPYEEDVIADNADDYVRGLAPGYAVSAVYSQTGPFTGVGSQPDASPEGFVVYDGGAQLGGIQAEYWNTLEIMLRDNQVWIWWNKLLVPPSAALSAALPTSVAVETPYFTLDQDPNRQFGKVGMRLWPGATVRRFDVRTQLSIFSEFAYGQLEVT
jgi:hypothetical protein